MASPSTKPVNRRRASSVTQALKQVPLNAQGSEPSRKSDQVQALSGPARPRKTGDELPEFYKSKGLLNDLRTGRWMVVPASSAKLLGLSVILWANAFARKQAGSIPEHIINPFDYLLFPMYKQDNGLYRIGLGDLAFLANYVIFWSLVRQSVTLYLLRPLAKRLGIKGAKIMRFTEQGYAIFYFTLTSVCGIYVMRGLPTWWYKTDQFWRGYPHRDLTLELKVYYLLQAAYWIQQTIILAAKIEKPRKDYKELVAHHFVTLYLIFWSYFLNFTYLGLALFVTMDVSDVFLALAKCVNYVDESASAPFFAFFVGVWTYFRHYLNWWLIWSVYAEFDLIPPHERDEFAPLQKGKWIVWWIKHLILMPMIALQLINLFWYFLILRILYRALFASKLADERSEDEDEGDEVTQGVEFTTEEKINVLKDGKAE